MNSDNIYPSLCILIIEIWFHRLDINKWASGSRRIKDIILKQQKKICHKQNLKKYSIIVCNGKFLT